MNAINARSRRLANLFDERLDRLDQIQSRDSSLSCLSPDAGTITGQAPLQPRESHSICGPRNLIRSSASSREAKAETFNQPLDTISWRCGQLPKFELEEGLADEALDRPIGTGSICVCFSGTPCWVEGQIHADGLVGRAQE